MLWPKELSAEACHEAYVYFDKNIRQLPKNRKGEFDEFSGGYTDNDVDAFRHAYVSGRFTHEYGSVIADIFGRLNEIFPAILYPSGGYPKVTNMDYWNNAVGRKYGRKTRKKETLLKGLHQALKAGELIIDLKDKRVYKGDTDIDMSPTQPVVVLKQSQTGRNEYFFDTKIKKTMSRSEFVKAIKAGRYPGYRVAVLYGVATPISISDGDSKNNFG